MTFRSRELLVGCFFVVLGATGFLLSSHYPFKVGPRIGPGAFPAMLAVVMILLGIAQCAVALRAQASALQERIRWRPILTICAAVVTFGLLVQRSGAVVALGLAAVIVSCADGRPKPWQVATVYTVILGFSYVVLVWLLGLQLPMFW